MGILKTFASRSAVAAAILAVGMGQASAAESGRYLVTYDIGAKDAVMAALPLGATVHHSFDHLGLVAVTLPSSSVDLLANVANVISVASDPIRTLSSQQVPYGIDQVNARDLWDADRDGVLDAGAPVGAGMKVCVVDTGIYAAHEDLGGGGVQILAGQSFVDEDWDQDRQGHGTHVAGSIAAMHNDRGVVGVSPGAVQLLIADVFNDAGEGQASSTILAAAEWCADQGANIISMSLGGPTPSAAIEAGYQDIVDRGVLIIAAAGNDSGPVDNYPASYPAVASVAALDNTETVADFSNFPASGEVELAGPGVAVLSTYPFENSLRVTGGPRFAANALANTPTGEVSGVLMDGGQCAGAPLPDQFADAIVLCERGGGTFGSKVDYAAGGGAVGTVLYNNEPGNFSGTYNQAAEGGVPSISLSQEDGHTARQHHLGDHVSVLVQAESTGGYAAISGTSMATPHVSGVAAVLWSACPDLDNDQIRAHLAATTREAQGDLLEGRDIWYGYGIVQVKEAVDALFDGIDEYDPASGSNNGTIAANVECPEPPAGPDAERAKGKGWVNANEWGQKITFSVRANSLGAFLDGRIKMKDKVTGDRVEADFLTGFSYLTEDCGTVAAGPTAVAVTADGTFNNQPASFRACAADLGAKNTGLDTFYLECTDGCSYSTDASDGVLQQGDVDVDTPEG